MASFAAMASLPDTLLSFQAPLEHYLLKQLSHTLPGWNSYSSLHALALFLPTERSHIYQTAPFSFTLCYRLPSISRVKISKGKGSLLWYPLSGNIMATLVPKKKQTPNKGCEIS